MKEVQEHKNKRRLSSLNDQNKYMEMWASFRSNPFDENNDQSQNQIYDDDD